jgi:hypothetical protein
MVSVVMHVASRPRVRLLGDQSKFFARFLKSSTSVVACPRCLYPIQWSGRQEVNLFDLFSRSQSPQASSLSWSQCIPAANS